MLTLIDEDRNNIEKYHLRHRVSPTESESTFDASTHEREKHNNPTSSRPTTTKHRQRQAGDIWVYISDLYNEWKLGKKFLSVFESQTVRQASKLGKIFAPLQNIWHMRNFIFGKVNHICERRNLRKKSEDNKKVKNWIKLHLWEIKKYFSGVNFQWGEENLKIFLYLQREEKSTSVRSKTVSSLE